MAGHHPHRGARDFGSELGNLASGLVRALTGVLLILALAMFLVWNPDFHESGFLSLFPSHFRPRLAKGLEQAGEALWFWFIGQGVAISASHWRKAA